MTAIAHNALKMVRKLGRGVSPPNPVASADVLAAKEWPAAAHRLIDFDALLWCFTWVSRSVFYPKPELQ